MECSICLEPIDTNAKTVTECNHTFHSSCIFKNIKFSNSCPICRTVLVEDSKKNETSEENSTSDTSGIIRYISMTDNGTRRRLMFRQSPEHFFTNDTDNFRSFLSSGLLSSILQEPSFEESNNPIDLIQRREQQYNRRLQDLLHSMSRPNN